MSKSKTSLSAQIVSTTSPAAGKNVLSELYEPWRKAEFANDVDSEITVESEK